MSSKNRPTDNEVRTLALRITQVFEITIEQAEAEAGGFLHYGYNSGKPAPGLGDRVDMLKRRLHSKYRWRSDEERIKFEDEQNQREIMHRILIGRRKGPRIK